MARKNYKRIESPGLFEVGAASLADYLRTPIADSTLFDEFYYQKPYYIKAQVFEEMSDTFGYCKWSADKRPECDKNYQHTMSAEEWKEGGWKTWENRMYCRDIDNDEISCDELACVYGPCGPDHTDDPYKRVNIQDGGGYTVGAESLSLTGDQLWEDIESGVYDEYFDASEFQWFQGGAGFLDAGLRRAGIDPAEFIAMQYGQGISQYDPYMEDLVKAGTEESFGETAAGFKEEIRKQYRSPSLSGSARDDKIRDLVQAQQTKTLQDDYRWILGKRDEYLTNLYLDMNTLIEEVSMMNDPQIHPEHQEWSEDFTLSDWYGEGPWT